MIVRGHGVTLGLRRSAGPRQRGREVLAAQNLEDARRLCHRQRLAIFPALVPQSYSTDTVLTGLLDRFALCGVLAEVEAVGLDLVEVRQLTPHRRSPKSGDGRSP